ncbi:hypothetical protein IID21_05235 [Patescibacteria group bacterium]|nr:hypothetical protein [Patescibacteria group bacterium]
MQREKDILGSFFLQDKEESPKIHFGDSADDDELSEEQDDSDENDVEDDWEKEE